MQNKYQTFPVILSANKHQQLVVLQNYCHVHQINIGNIILMRFMLNYYLIKVGSRESLRGFSFWQLRDDGGLTNSW